MREKKQLVILELFAGTRSIGKSFEKKGHKVYSVDWDKSFENIDLNIDIRELSSQQILDTIGRPDIIWASPDCTTYSVAAIHYHRNKEENGNLAPKTEYAKQCDLTNEHVINLINELQPKVYFIENPRGGFRKMNFLNNLPDMKRYTVTYCQYGDTRMKPTDIFTNLNTTFKSCKNGDKCHVPAPRGSQTGTQGIKGKKNRAIIPEQLCDYIVEISENYIYGEDKND